MGLDTHLKEIITAALMGSEEKCRFLLLYKLDSPGTCHDPRRAPETQAS